MKTLQIFLIIGFLYSPKFLFAQRDSVKLRNGYFIGVGIAAGAGSDKGVYVLAHVQVQRFTSYLSFKTSGFAVLNIMGSEPVPTISEASLLFGKSYTLGKSHNLQFGTGLSLLTAISRGEKLPCKSCSFFESSNYETIRKHPVGVPMEMKYNYYLDRTGAISFSLNTNINKEQSFFGVAIGFIAGRLRPNFTNK